MWDQPIQGTGKSYPKNEWLAEKLVPGRRFGVFVIEVKEHDPWVFLTALKRIEGRRGQPLRTAFRYLRLWPRPAWNCTSPVRKVLNALGLLVKGETPDALRQELSRYQGFPSDLKNTD